MSASISTFLFAMIAGVILTPVVIRIAGVWGLFDAPQGDRRVHTQPLPRIGGVAIFAAMGLGIIASLGLAILTDSPRVPSASLLFGIFFGAAIVFGTGLLDDLRGLKPLPKFTLQASAAIIVYLHGFQIQAIQLGSFHADLGWLALPITLLWIVGVTNAFNLIDGLDGLASGLAVVALAVTLIFSTVSGSGEIALLSVALLGALVGFLRYNFNPAKIFLGDSGSLLIGFLVAILSAAAAQRDGSAVLIVIPVFALAIPLLDTGIAIMRRWLRGVPLSQADGRHIHHRLLALGFSHRDAVVVLYVAAGAVALLGLSLVFAPAPSVISVATAGGGTVLAVLFYGLRRLQYHEFMEARTVVFTGALRLRHAIRNQINAHDLAQLIKLARSKEDVAAILGDGASTFGFLHMEVCKETAPGSRPLMLVNGHASRAWKLDCPVTPHNFVDGEDYVLRIWCNPQIAASPFSAERVAHTVVPALEELLVDRGLLNAIVDGSQVAMMGDQPVRMDDAEDNDQSRVNGRPARRPSGWVVENSGR